uniref:Uncharacterized protein n=1 Tax=uncultured Alphaproteobacteria bacterium TaxID=91750 RepID=A0A6G8F3C1_9PROT|nr:hypothetical protein PlAlph_6820 [uncultured Alphaproteobacteria bacterium]
MREQLPLMDEIITAMCERCLGEGQEVKVYKIDTNPDFTVQVSHDAPPLAELQRYLRIYPFVPQKDIFEGRNYAQPVAYWSHPDINGGDVLLTINRYSPGFSIEIQKPGLPAPDSEEALIKTRVWSEKMANMPDRSYDVLYDDLHFLSSRRYSIDVCSMGLFTNTGNILYSSRDQEAYIIDVQPFIQKPGISPTQTKGFNTPLYLTRGLLPGAASYAKEHAADQALIKLRTEIVAKSIAAAKRNRLNDVGGYLKGNMDSMLHVWELQLRRLNIPEHYHNDFLNQIGSIKQETRYGSPENLIKCFQIRGCNDYS